MIGRLGLVLLAVATLAGTASAAGSNPKDPKKRFNAADQAWARAIPIRRADLGRGDWRVEPSDDDDEDDSDAPAGCKNPDMSDLVLTGESENSDWSLNGSIIGSAGEIWSSERHAAIAWKRGSSYPFAKCMAATMKQEFGNARIKLTIQSSGTIPMSKLAPRMLTYRMRFRIKGPAGTFNGRFSLYFFSRGRADGMLMVVSFQAPGLRPIPESLERRLATLVAGRLGH
jgi:hypothetical protein